MAFDADYYQRYYESGATRVYGPAEIAHLARGVTGMIDWFGAPLGRVLDVGAGTGLWRDWFAAHRKEAAFMSSDVSAYACERYGHEQHDIARWRSDEEFDLIVCQGVLPYLDDEACGAAIENLAAMTRGFLYLLATTQDDITRAAVDPSKTDLDMHWRPGRFYLSLLAPHFLRVGCGLFYSRRGELKLFELERGA